MIDAVLLALVAVASVTAVLARRATAAARASEHRYRVLAAQRSGTEAALAGEKASQHALEEQRGFLAAVLKQLGERVIVADAEGKIVDFGAHHTAGRTELHPLECAEAFELTHPDGQRFGPHEAPLLRALRGEDVRDVELRVDTPAGTLALLASGGPVTTPEGRMLGAVVVNADLTAFRDAEGRLRRGEERHRRVVESMVDCVFETDGHGRWTYLSENWAAATGHAVQDTLGRSCWDFVHPGDRARHARALAPMLAGERADARLRHRFLTTTGVERWAEVQVRAISGWDGLPTGFVGVMRDVTDPQRAQQQARSRRERRHAAALERAGARGHGPGPARGARRRAGLGRGRAVADVRRRAPAPRRGVDRPRRPARPS